VVTGAVPDRYRPYLDLAPDVQPNGTPDPDSGAVLVTGATGFFGSALLAEVLAQRPDRPVYCLVRPEDGPPEKRLRRSLGELELWEDEWADRVHPVAGDLSEPGAGLAPADAERLRQEVSLIYHSGAFVNLAFPFEQVQAANVGGSVEVLRLAGTGRPKRVCHISTLSTVDINSRTGEELDDPAPLGEFEAMTTGYTRSKWVAEQLVAQAAARGLDVRTMRLGALAGHSRTGVSNPNDYAWLVVCACLAIGAVPLMRAPTSWLPVDLVAQATITLTAVPSSHYRPYQILPAGQNTYADIFSWLRRAGYHLPAMAFPQWRERLRQQADQGPRAVQAIASVIPKAGLPGEAQADLHSPRTEAVLLAHGGASPRMTEATFRTFLAAGQRRAEIPPPTT
jgi:thioester reductase-like protein